MGSTTKSERVSSRRRSRVMVNGGCHKSSLEDGHGTAVDPVSSSPGSTSSMSTVGSSVHHRRPPVPNIIHNPNSTDTNSTKHPFKRYLFHGCILFAIFYVQIAANFFAYHFRLIRQQWMLDKATKLRERQLTQEEESLQTLSNLQLKLERYQTLLTAETNTFASNADDIFFPFTIRDARRSIPTQIPHGFHIFDRIDLQDPDDGADDDAKVRPTTNTTTAASDTVGNATDRWPAPSLYHNGHIISRASDGTYDDDYGCPSDTDDYSLRCYRATILRVFKYLLQTTHARYYFYMEADNDLCTTLSDLRNLTLTHQRYFISTGVGFSGWIMSRQFVQDFYDWYRKDHMGALGDTDAASGFNISWLPKGIRQQPDALLRPEVIGSVLLNEKRAWSVTRRYLTSHSILAAGGADSLTELFEVEDDDKDASKAPSAVASAKDEAEDRNSDNSNNHTAPVFTPRRHLPRCLEPHRGIWPVKSTSDKTTNSTDDSDNVDGETGDVGTPQNQHDMFRWGYFVYDWCPDSPIFPCHDGQLDALVEE